MEAEYYIPKKCPKCGSIVAIKYMKDVLVAQKKSIDDIPDNQYGCGSCGNTWIDGQNNPV